YPMQADYVHGYPMQADYVRKQLAYYTPSGFSNSLDLRW
ncbi:MAG: hypothetical protein ACJAWK_000746, partial [Candidatus Azotimanducaceae bacterium]